MNTAQILLGVSTLVAAALVAGCGGGGDNASAPGAGDPLRQVPASASQSTAGLVGYLQSLPRLDAETLEPASLDAFRPKTTDDTEPLPVGG